MRVGLRVKFIFFFVLLVLAPLFLLGAASLFILERTQIKAVATTEHQFLVEKQKEINRLFNDATALFEIRTGSEDVSPISARDQQFLAEKILGSNRFILEVSFIDLSGQETLKIRRGEEAFVASKVGNIGASELFRVARKGDVFFGPVETRDGGSFMNVARPVRNRSNLIIMLVAGEINLDNVKSLVQGVTLGDKGYMIVTDSKGVIFAASREEFIGKSPSNSSWIKGVIEGRPAVGLKAEDRFMGLGSVPVFASGVSIRAPSWGLVVEWPRDDALSPIKDTRRFVFGFFAAIGIVIAVLGFFAANKILVPLAILKKGARLIGTGNFDYKIQIRSGDELEELGTAFNRMGDDLKKLDEWRMKAAKSEALEKAFRLEKEISKSKSNFITNTSHQLRTPISILGWSLELALAEQDKKEQATQLQSAWNGLEQLRAIVNDLLIISEFGIGYTSERGMEINLGALLSEVVGRQKEVVKTKKIAFKTEIGGDLPKIYGSRVGMQKVFENLLDNTFTYTQEGGEVSLRLQCKGKDIWFTIKDTGIGIPDGDKPSIFSAFFRAGNSVEMKNVGTGLGLLICKNIIEGHGGKIWFESKRGEGTTFYFTLPLPEAEKEKEEQALSH